MIFNPSLLGSGWILVHTLASALATVCVRFTQGGYTYSQLMLAQYWLVTVVCAAVMFRRGISFFSPYWKTQLFRLLMGLVCAYCALILRHCLPVGMAQTFMYSTPLYIVFGLLAIRFFQGGINATQGIYIAATILCFAAVVGTLPLDSQFLSPFTLSAGICFGIVSACTAFCLKYFGKHSEPVARTVFYFGLGACLAGIAGIAWEGSEMNAGILFEPPLVILSIFIGICHLAKAYGWGYCSPWLNSIFLFSGIPAALVLGYVFFDEKLNSSDLLLVTVISITSLICAGLHSFRTVKQRAISNEQ